MSAYRLTRRWQTRGRLAGPGRARSARRTGSPPRMPRGARPGRRHRAPSSPARSGLGASSHQPGPRCARKPNRLRRWRLLGTTRSGDCRKRIRLRHPGIAARPGRLVVPSTISSMGDDDVDRPEPPSAKAVTALLREARSLSRRADKLNGTAAAVDDPTTQQLAAEACTSAWSSWCTTSCCWNVRHSAASSHQLGAGRAAAVSALRRRWHRRGRVARGGSRRGPGVGTSSGPAR